MRFKMGDIINKEAYFVSLISVTAANFWLLTPPNQGLSALVSFLQTFLFATIIASERQKYLSLSN